MHRPEQPTALHVRRIQLERSAWIEALRALPDHAWDNPSSTLPIPAPEAEQQTSPPSAPPPPLPLPPEDTLIRWAPFFRLPHPNSFSTPGNVCTWMMALLLLTGLSSSCTPMLLDLDQDGWPQTLDCDDTNDYTWPGAPEVPYNGIDEDCSGLDLRDQDGDGAEARSVGGDDCNDQDPAVAPNAPEICDGQANRCDAYVDDADRDGHVAQTCLADIYRGDCNDFDPSINPFADEIPYDGIDQDCYSGDLIDADYDGEAAWHSGGSDCDDSDPHVHSETERLILAGLFLASPPHRPEGLEPLFVNSFCMDRGEVTLDDYRLCVVRGTCTPPAALAYSSSLQSYYQTQANSSLPVVGVTLEQARTYCQTVGKQLPDPWRWQKAGRGGVCLEGDSTPCPVWAQNPDADRTYPWGEALPTCTQANFQAGATACAPQSSGLPVLGRDALPAGASPYDIRHLAGNVAEWLEPLEPTLEPGLAMGGSFMTGAIPLRLETLRLEPTSTALPWLGFRCMRTLEHL